MAEALGTEIFKVFVEKLASGAYRETLSALEIDSDIKQLQHRKAIIEATLLDADALMHPNSHAQQAVLEQLRCGVDELDDFLDAKAARAKQKELMSRNSKFLAEFRLFFSASNQLVSRYRDARKVKAIRENLDHPVRDYSQLGNLLLSMLPAVNQTRALNLNVETGSHILEEEVIGRDRDRDYIVNQLVDSGSGSGLCAVSIVGIGGVGKTTLAQYVYNNERVKTHFELRLWVFATQVFNIREVLETILACATDQEKPRNLAMDQLQCRLVHEISGKRFLLVVDNVWDHDCLGQHWEDLRRLLVIGAKGSQVLVTTRSETVARVTGTDMVPYRLRELGEDDSWHLFRRFAFRGQGQVEPGMEAIGKEIARRCRKVPLVLQTIGSLLAEKGTIQEWKAFRDDEFANLASYGRGIVQTLKLSYDQLDPKLKLCFAYCSLFGKFFYKHAMVRMWIALGYIKPRYENQSLEDAGEEYVMSLLDRGFFYRASKDEFGRINSFRMHDLMHDLVLSIAQFKYQRVDCNKSYEFDERVRHVYFDVLSSPAVDAFLFDLSSPPSKSKQLQSLFLKECPSDWDKARLRNLVPRFPGLRVLQLTCLKTREVPSCIGGLIHLRYLDLSDNYHLQRLSNSITQLVNLLSLDLSYCYELRELPKGMSKLVNLRHLNLKCCNKLTHMPLGLGKLTDLRTLWRFVAVAGGGGLSELNRLNNLEGSLVIQVGGQSKEEAMAANMKGKEKLRQLRIEFNKGRGSSDEKVLEALQPRGETRILNLRGPIYIPTYCK